MKENHHICPWWLAYSFDNPIRSLFHNPEKLFASYVQEGMRVADVGCGMGYFSIGLARLVGKTGTIYSIDIQKKMLDILVKRAAAKSVEHLIVPRMSTSAYLNLPQELDFILAFWMVHETGDKGAFFIQVSKALKPGGLLYMTEPKMHVSTQAFENEIAVATRFSFQIKTQPVVALSRAAVLIKTAKQSE